MILEYQTWQPVLVYRENGARRVIRSSQHEGVSNDSFIVVRLGCQRCVACAHRLRWTYTFTQLFLCESQSARAELDDSAGQSDQLVSKEKSDKKYRYWPRDTLGQHPKK